MSGSTIGGVVGGAIGYYVSGGTAQGAQIGWMIGSAVGGYVDPDVIKGPKLTDAQALTVQEGAFRAIVYGTAVVGGNIIHTGPLVEHKNRERTGKGGPVQETYSYTRTIAIALGEPLAGILRIWQDGKLVYDARNPAQWPDAAKDIRAMAADTGKYASKFKFYSGSETQLPDPSLEALDESWGGGVGNVPAYRGTSYVVFPNLDCTQSGGAVSQFRFEVACCGDTSTSINDVPWVHGYTGSAQHTFTAGIFQTTAIAAGWNDNLRRTTDGGATWNAIPYTDDLSWNPAATIVAAFHVQDPAVGPQGVWYISNGVEMAASYDAGASFTHYLTIARTMLDGYSGAVYQVGGTYYAGSNEGTVTTAIFQPLIATDTTRQYIGDFGYVTCIGDLDGSPLIGTNDGKIVNVGGTVLYSGTGAIQTMASDGVIVLASLSAGGYVRYDGSTWTLYPTGSVGQFCFARGVFYRTAGVDSIEASHDGGLTWTVLDTSINSGGLGFYIVSDGYSVLAVSGEGHTAALPTAYVLPDVLNWMVDLVGNIVGATTVTTDKCDANVADIVADQCARVGIPASRIDLTGLTDTVRGFAIGKQGTASDNIKPLQAGFFFDFPEWGDSADLTTKLRAIKRGAASVVTITDDDLVQSDEDQDTRAQAVEFPRKINLITADVDADYNPTKQTAERETENVKAVGESTVELPISAVRSEAAQIVDKMLKVAWAEAEGTWERELPAEFTRYVPSNCFTHNSRRWRIERAEQGDGSVKWTAKRDRPRAYLSNAASETPIHPAPPVLSLRGPTMFAAMNLPSLRSADNVPGMYIAACGLLDGWAGCDLQLSTDGGLTYVSVATLTNECTMGDLTANADTSGTINARVYHRHTLESVTDAQIAARANAFAIVTSNTAEIGQFKTATDTGAQGEYALTDCTRGELGTAAATHRTGDRFVLLDGAVFFLKLDVSLAGQTLYFRPVSLGTVAANNVAYPVVFSPQFTTGASIDFYTDASGNRYTDAASAFYYEET